MKWVSAGSQDPAAGDEVVHEPLATALHVQTVFTQGEWDALRVPNITRDSYVKVGDTYFRPDVVSRYFV